MGIAVLDLALYMLAAAALSLRLLRIGPTFLKEHRGFAASSAGAAVLLHSVALYGLIFTVHGLNLGFFNTAALEGWLVALIALFTLFKPAFDSLGIVLFPLTGIAVVLAQALPADQLVVGDRSWPLDTHILISLLAYSLLTVAALQAAVLALQEHRLRTGAAGGILSALPPLQEMEQFLFQLIAAGFVLLTVALFTGFIFVQNIMAQHLEHKIILSLTAWLVFAVLLWGRWRYGWRGRTAIRWTLGGFVVLVLAYTGSKLVLELILGRHWGLMS